MDYTDIKSVQNRLTYEIALYREQLMLLQKEMQKVSSTSSDLENAVKTSRDIEEKSLLVPVGGGTYIKAKAEARKLIVPIGAQYLKEMDPEDATKELERRKEATGKAMKKLEEQYNNIASKYQDAAKNLQNVQSRVQISDQVEENISDDYI